MNKLLVFTFLLGLCVIAFADTDGEVNTSYFILYCEVVSTGQAPSREDGGGVRHFLGPIFLKHFPLQVAFLSVFFSCSRSYFKFMSILGLKFYICSLHGH